MKSKHGNKFAYLVFIIFDQDFCDGIFYSSYTECFGEDLVPTMSDSFDSMLMKLKDLQWNSITSTENLPRLPEKFDSVRTMDL